MGEVYRARDPRLGREVAIKVIASDREADPIRYRRFADEARAAGALNHPNVLSVFDTGLVGGSPYIVFELLEGETLRHRLQRGPLPPRKAVEYAVQTCDALAAAHERGIVHRDLKPDNLFLTRDGRVKILDLGLAKLTEEVSAADDASGTATRTATTPGLLLGTVAYMSPEQARGQAADARSDLFALGATLYEMLSGRPAFQRATPADTLSAILTQDPEDIGPAPGNSVPAAIRPILRRCLEKDPGQRFQSARDLGFALNVLSGSTPAGGDGTNSARPKGKGWLLPLIVGALAVSAVASYVLRRPTRTQAAHMSARPFTAFRGQEVAPSFSPDGSQIAFAWTGEDEPKEDEFNLYVKVMGSETPLRLTTHPAKWMSPAWSPDGRRIAFSRAGEDGRGIYMVSPLGGPERKLLDVRSGAFDYFVRATLSWSPDGKLLAFSDADVPSGPPVIALLNVDTLEKRQLDTPSKDCVLVWAPAFSPAGRFLAVACVLAFDRNELFVLPAAGGTARSIGVVQGDFSGLAWTADETHVVFTSDGNVWRVSAGGGEIEMLLPGRDARSLAVSRGGHGLAYAQWTVNTNIWRVPLASPTRSAGPPERLFTSSRVQRNPAFSPDGRRLAFESTRSGTLEIWMSDADGSDPVPVTSFGGPLTGSPQWSPDGRQIALDSRAGGEAAVYVASLEGGPPRRIATGIGESSVPAWSGDGRWFYFSAPVSKTDQIFKVRTEGGSAIQLTKQGGFFPRPSRDGRRVYYVKYKSAEMWSVSANGGDERPVSGMPRRSAEWGIEWALAASGIYFVDGDPPRPGIHFFEFATRRTTRIVDIPGRPEPWVGGLALSPDGRSLLYSQRDEIASDIMLVEDFR